MDDMPDIGEIPMSLARGAPYVRTQEYNSGISHGAGIPPVVFLDLEQEDRESNTVIVNNIVLRQATHPFPEGDFVPPGFWDRVQLEGFSRRFKKSQWNYEMRREAQQVFPFVSLGPWSCLRDREALRNQGFTLLLAIRNTRCAQVGLVSADKAAADLGIQSDTIDVSDVQELISVFPQAIRRINDHLAGMDVDSNNGTTTEDAQGAPVKKKVVVFCESGNERSAGVVIAYTMVMTGMDYAHALHFVQQHRFSVSLDEPMKRILLAFEAILAAKRDVERARQTTTQASPSSLAPPTAEPSMLSKKRSFADCEDSDIEMVDFDMDVDDEEWVITRKPLAPFQDRVP